MSLSQIWTICAIWNTLNITYNSYKVKQWNFTTALAYIVGIILAPLMAIVGLAVGISELF